MHDNLTHLGVNALDVVNLRLHAMDAPTDEPIGDEFTVLAELQQQGLIRHLGLSNASSAQLTEAQAIAPVVTIQNLYNVANRHDDELVDRCAAEGIAFVPFFPLGGFSPLQADALNSVATQLETSTQQVALAWLLQRSPAIALIPGTSSTAHLRENRGRRPAVAGRRDHPAQQHREVNPGSTSRSSPASRRNRWYTRHSVAPSKPPTWRTC